MHVTFEWSGWSGEIKMAIMCVSYTVYTLHNLISFRSSVWSLLPYPGTRRCGCVWPSLVARLDSKQQLVQLVTHFCLFAGAKWACWFAAEGKGRGSQYNLGGTVVVQEEWAKSHSRHMMEFRNLRKCFFVIAKNFFLQ